jgi:hypothetical protein
VDDGSALSNCAASSNTLTGISGGIVAAESCALTNCAASSNAAQYGLNTGLGAMLLNCSATNNNPARYGIFVGPGGSLTNGASYSNVVSQGINPAAIGASSGAVVVDSTAGSNNAGGSSAYDKGVGFFLGGLSIVQQCNARSNTGAGILLGVSRSIARANNVVANNPSSGLPSGISLLPNSSFNRIEGNNVTDNEIVQILTDSHSIVITNTLSGDIYVIDSGNSLGAIIDDTGGGGAAVNGSSASATFGSPNAWANITY